MVIDFHTHAFPEKIASRVLESLSAAAGGLLPNHGGTAESLKRETLKNGAQKAVLLNIATNPKQEHNVNSFAISLLEDDVIIPFGSINPDSENIDSELKRLYDAGIKGIKLHPDYQHFFADEERMLPIYEKIASYGFITVFHAGVDIGYPTPVHCTPEMLRKILPHFGSSPVVAAHFGGFRLWDDVIKHLSDTDIYIDTSFSAGRIAEDTAKKILSVFNNDRILFGSDMPWGNSAREIDFISSICDSEPQRDKILYKNAQGLLNINNG